MASTFAEATLTVSDAFDDTETCTIGSKVYTAQAVLTDVDGNFLAGADGEETLENLKAAINLEAGAGMLYADSMTEHPAVEAVSASATELLVRSKIAGLIGNEIAVSETGGEHAWDDAFLSGGTGDAVADLEAEVAALEGDVAEVLDIVEKAPAGIRQAVIDATGAVG